MFSDLQAAGKVQQVFLVHIINYKFILSLVILLCFLLQAANRSVKMPVFIINNEKQGTAPQASRNKDLVPPLGISVLRRALHMKPD